MEATTYLGHILFLLSLTGSWEPGLYLAMRHTLDIVALGSEQQPVASSDLSS